MLFYLIGLLLSFSCAWRVHRQQRGKRLLLCNILVILSALMYAPYILRSLNSPFPMHAFFVAMDACPLLAVLPLLFYSSPAGKMGECLPHLRQSGSRDRRPRRSGELQDDSQIIFRIPF